MNVAFNVRTVSISHFLYGVLLLLDRGQSRCRRILHNALILSELACYTISTEAALYTINVVVMGTDKRTMGFKNRIIVYVCIV
jgi:hypothetical protein